MGLIWNIVLFIWLQIDIMKIWKYILILVNPVMIMEFFVINIKVKVKASYANLINARKVIKN